MLKRLFVAAFIAGMAFTTAPAALADQPAIFKPFLSDLAVSGFDPVAYFKGNGPTPGDAGLEYAWQGAKWRFASAENRAAFKANPQKYAPQFGGYCAWAVSQGYTAKGDPKFWRIVDGKLYLNYDGEVQKKWEKDIPGLVAKGNANWPAILKK